MKNLIILLAIASISISLTSCDGGYHGQPDGTHGPQGQHNNQPGVSVQVVVSSGGGPAQPGVPSVPVMIPLTSALLYLPVAENYWFTDYSLSHPNERYRTVGTIDNQDYQIATTQATLYAIRTYGISNGYNPVNISIGTLVGYNYSVPEIVGYYRLMQNSNGQMDHYLTKILFGKEECPKGFVETFDGGYRVAISMTSGITTEDLVVNS